jgi:hypothetical protein
MMDIICQGLCHGGPLRSVSAEFRGLCDEFVVNLQVGSHDYHLHTYYDTTVCVYAIFFCVLIFLQSSASTYPPCNASLNVITKKRRGGSASIAATIFDHIGPVSKTPIILTRAKAAQVALIKSVPELSGQVSGTKKTNIHAVAVIAKRIAVLLFLSILFLSFERAS